MGSSPSKAGAATTASVTEVKTFKSGAARADASAGASPAAPAPPAGAAVARTEASAAAPAGRNGGEAAAIAAAAPLTDTAAATKVAVVLSHHSDNAALAAAIAEALADRCDVALMIQSQPATLKQRESLIAWCSAFIVVASIGYQRDMALMETVNHARTKHKTVVAVIGQRRYRPFGGLGVISIADGELLDGTEWTDAGRFSALVESMRSRLFAVTRPPAAPRPTQPGDDAAQPYPISAAASGASVSAGSAAGSGIAVSYHSETEEVRALLESETFGAPIVGILNESSSAGSPALAACTVLVAILSPAYEQSAACREQYERARALRKPIVPLIGAAGNYSPSGWAALAIAGKLYYKFSNRASAYDNFKHPYLDTVPMVDFKLAVNAQLAPLPDAEARERAEIDVLTKKIAECRAKLQHLPPKAQESDGAGQSEPPEPPILTMAELLAFGADGPLYDDEHLKVKRLEFKPPRPLFDSRGIPIRERIDVFISYQRDQQDFVSQVYKNMHVTFHLKAWMDGYGGMQDNTNEALANGIECSDVFLCFLSAKYVASANCTLETRYALYRKKALVFMMTQDDLELPPWIDALVKSSLTFSLRSMADCRIEDNDLPRMDRICDAVRRLSAKSYHSTYDEDVTEAVTSLRATLENALLALAEQENVARWNTCTRCGAQFDDDSRSGCKKHSASFMIGKILVGRWMCCNQRMRDSPGCASADHTTMKRVFRLAQFLHTYEWVPA